MFMSLLQLQNNFAADWLRGPAYMRPCFEPIDYQIFRNLPFSKRIPITRTVNGQQVTYFAHLENNGRNEYSITAINDNSKQEGAWGKYNALESVFMPSLGGVTSQSSYSKDPKVTYEQLEYAFVQQNSVDTDQK